MKPRVYRILREAVEVGVQRGWNRAHEYSDCPRHEVTLDAIEQAVIQEVSERFRFEDKDEDKDENDDAPRWGPGSRTLTRYEKTGDTMNYLRSKLEGWKTYGTAW